MASAVLIYDGECSMCRASALWLMRRALAGGARGLEILPCQSPARRARFPRIDDTVCPTALQLLLPDGRLPSGADAPPGILAPAPRWGRPVPPFARPGVP